MHYDPEKVARVWQRVQGKEPALQELPPLMEEHRQEAAAYFSLARRFQGSGSAMLNRMAEEAQQSAACLRGIYAIRGETPPQVSTPAPDREPTETILRRCYGRAIRRHAAYTARAEDPAFGPVFARLAAQERDHCKNLLTLLGRLR